MTGRLKRIKTLLAEEFDELYAFPIFEVLCFFLISLMFWGITSFSVGSGGGSPSSFIDQTFYLKSSLEHYEGTLSIASFLLSIIVPVFISTSVAGSYESGLMKTFLSYPIKRLELIGLKLLGTFLAFATIMISGIILSSPFSPMKLPLSSLAVGILSILLGLSLVIAVSLFFSIILKRSVSALGISILFWFVLHVSMPSSGTSYIYIFKPSHALLLWGFDQTLTISDVCLALLGPALVSAALISVSFIYAKKKLEV